MQECSWQPSARCRSNSVLNVTILREMREFYNPERGSSNEREVVVSDSEKSSVDERKTAWGWKMANIWPRMRDWREETIPLEPFDHDLWGQRIYGRQSVRVFGDALKSKLSL